MEHGVRAAPCQQGNMDKDSGKINKKINSEVLMMLKIWKNYYLDASRVCYTLKKAHTKADGGVEYNICTYHTRLEEALAEAVRRTIPGRSRQRGAEGMGAGACRTPAVGERGTGAAAIHLPGGPSL